MKFDYIGHIAPLYRFTLCRLCACMTIGKRNPARSNRHPSWTCSDPRPCGGPVDWLCPLLQRLGRVLILGVVAERGARHSVSDERLQLRRERPRNLRWACPHRTDVSGRAWSGWWQAKRGGMGWGAQARNWFSSWRYSARLKSQLNPQRSSPLRFAPPLWKVSCSPIHLLESTVQDVAGSRGLMRRTPR